LVRNYKESHRAIARWYASSEKRKKDGYMQVFVQGIEHTNFDGGRMN